MVVFQAPIEEMAETKDGEECSEPCRRFSASYITKDIYLERLRRYVLLRAKERDIIRKTEEAARLEERVNLARERRHSVGLLPNHESRSAPNLVGPRSPDNMTSFRMEPGLDYRWNTIVRDRTSSCPKEMTQNASVQPVPAIQVTPVRSRKVFLVDGKETQSTRQDPHKLSPSEERILEAKKKWSVRVETLKALDIDLQKANEVMARVRAVSLPQGLNNVGLEDETSSPTLQHKIYNNLRRPSFKGRSSSFV